MPPTTSVYQEAPLTKHISRPNTKLHDFS